MVQLAVKSEERLMTSYSWLIRLRFDEGGLNVSNDSSLTLDG
jgi:hypothetical protein